MEIAEITVYRKGTRELITRIFEDENGIKEITDDDYVVDIQLKSSSEDEQQIQPRLFFLLLSGLLLMNLVPSERFTP